METRYYQAQGIDIDRLANELERMFLMQGYQAQHFGNNDQLTVQIKKGGDFAAIIGMQRALTLTMERGPGGVLAMIGQQKWADKAAVGVVGMLVLWPLAFTAGAGAIQQAQLGTQVLGSLDMLVRQQIPNVQVGPIPPNMMPQYQQPGAPPPPPSYAQQTPHQQQAGPASTPPVNKVICANCHAENDEGAIYCMSCGRALAPQESQKILCPVCGAETKPNATFCTQCGTPLSHGEGHG
jgi:ribosomal protein L40E